MIPKMDTLETIKPIMLCLAGSHAYGTNIETSDIDKRGIFIGNKYQVWGMLPNIEQIQDKGNNKDIEFHEIKRYLHLCTEQNPNIIEIIWTEDADVLEITEQGKLLVAARDILLSSKAKHTFSGYAHAQLKRIKGHNKWLSQEEKAVDKIVDLLNNSLIDFDWIKNNFKEKIVTKVANQTSIRPQSKQGYDKMLGYFRDSDINLVSTYGPQVEYYCKYIDETGHVEKLSANDSTWLDKTYAVRVTDEIYRIYNSCYHETAKPGVFNDKNKAEIFFYFFAHFDSKHYDGILIVNREDFKRDLIRWKQYHEWTDNRNIARSELEEKFGYDSKHLMHLVRLLRMGKEILEEGVVKVKRPDAEELKAIRNGLWTYDEAIAYAENMDKELDVLYQKTKLRHSVDIKFVNKLYMDIAESYYYGG